MDSVEILERSNPAGPCSLCPDGYVYNLSVEHLRNYTANGFLVHNCHHASANTYGDILANYPGSYVLGLTATPFRLDGRGLGDVFGTIVVAAHTDDLVRAGVLHRPRVWAAAGPDLRGIKRIAGEYALGELADRANTPELCADIVESWKKHADGRRTVCFAVDVEHSRAIVEAFHDAGVAAEHLDGSMPDDARTTILDRLRVGWTEVVSNCMVLTEGWDLPALECAIIARPTASLNLHLQMIGRVMRAAEGKAGAIVLDHAGNHHIHGLVTRRLTYTLDTRGSTGKTDALGLVRCEACGLLFETFRSLCPECGWARAIERQERERPDVRGPGELVEFDDDSHAYRAHIWRLIRDEREAGGYAEGWAAHRYRERFGVWPLLDAAADLIDPHAATLEQKAHVYERFVATAERKGLKRGWAAHRYREVFGVWPGGGIVGGSRREELRERFAGYRR